VARAVRLGNAYFGITTRRFGLNRAMSSPSRSHTDTLELLDELCRDSLEVPLSHVDALERDGLLDDYEISAKFKRVRDDIVSLRADLQRLEEALRQIAERTESPIGSVSAWKALEDIEQMALAALHREKPQ